MNTTNQIDSFSKFEETVINELQRRFVESHGTDIILPSDALWLVKNGFPFKPTIFTLLMPHRITDWSTEDINKFLLRYKCHWKNCTESQRQEIFNKSVETLWDKMTNAMCTIYGG